jgi:hypothetical protein
MVVGEERPRERVTYQMNLETADPSIRRAVMKIALCFAREQGFRLNPSAIGCVFLRGEAVPIVPFGLPTSDVVAIADFPDSASTPLHHAIFLKRSGSRLLAYVTLFSLYEFVLLLDENCEDFVDAHTSGYFWNFMVDWAEARAFDWVSNDEDFLSRLGGAMPHAERFQERGASLIRCMSDPQGHGLQRAMAAGAKEYMRLREQGALHSAAEEGANARAAKIAASYGISIAELEISFTPSE